MEYNPQNDQASPQCPDCARFPKALDVDVHALFAHPAISLIYGKHPDDLELNYSVSRRGILEPLHVLNDGTVLSGRRRLQSAFLAGLLKVPVIKIPDLSPLAELEYILDSNSQNFLFRFQQYRIAEVRLEIGKYKFDPLGHHSRVLDLLLRGSTTLECWVSPEVELYT